MTRRRGGNWDDQTKESSSGLTQGLMTPSLKETRPGLMHQFTLRARIPWTWVLTSASPNSAWNERSKKLGPGYLHIVISCRHSGWM
jgi:hypothetical protein